MRASTSKRCLSARTPKQTYQGTTAMCINAAYAQHASYDMHRGTARATYNTLLTRGIVVTDNAHHLHRSTDQQGWALANSHERVRDTTYNVSFQRALNNAVSPIDPTALVPRIQRDYARRQLCACGCALSFRAATSIKRWFRFCCKGSPRL